MDYGLPWLRCSSLITFLIKNFLSGSDGKFPGFPGSSEGDRGDLGLIPE